MLSVRMPCVKPRTDAHRLYAIPNFKGRQYERGIGDYEKKREQYATSSYVDEHRMSPAIVAYPASGSMDDIKSVVKYAKDNKIAVAVRTGGHQYSGASSTIGGNIQLDMSEVFKNDISYTQDNGKHIVRTSVSWKLIDVNKYLGEKGLFIPHGQCCHVHIGGHVQTGGYGQLGRSFGLFGDHVLSLDIINSDGIEQNVSKDKDPDLFFALLGGSPGNFGLITHFTFQAYSDKDYEGSCGLKGLYRYSDKTLKNLLDILVSMAKDKEFPRNYDYCISVVSSNFPLPFLVHIDTDADVQAIYAQLRANGETHPRAIVVYAQYVPFEGTDKCNDSWFESIINAGPHLLHPVRKNKVEMLPMSRLTRKWIFTADREYQHPYVKRTYATTSAADEWSGWVTGRVDDIISNFFNRCWLSVQIQNFGGNYSKFFLNRDNGTSYSWRDSSIVCTLDCFYDEKKDNAKNTAKQWQEINDVEGIDKGIFSKEDRRVLWGSYSRDSSEFDWTNSWPRYHDNKEKYDRLRDIKRKVDPNGVFTANKFGVQP